MVSKLPLGIWRTRLIVLGTATTILDPLSTLRVGHSAGAVVVGPSSWSNNCGIVAIGANMASCVLVVKMTEPEAMANDVALVDSVRVSSSDLDTYSLPDFAKPTYRL